jgi:hypothetical protein
MAENRSWSWRHAVLKSGLPATTRHVLLTISCFMNDVGGGCYPTQEQLAEASGLTDRAVRQHIDAAVKAGWLVRKEHGFRGQKWRNHEYEAAWPTQDVDAAALPIDKGEEPASGPFSEGAERHAEGAERDDKKVRNDVPTILPEHSSNQRVDARASDAIFEEFDQFVWAEFPRNPNSDKSTAYAAYTALSRSDQFACLRGITRYSIRFDEAKTDEPLDQRLKYHTHLHKWIMNRAWEQELALA